MRNEILVALVVLTVGASAAEGQRRPAAGSTSAPHSDISVGYNYVRANAPPGVSEEFNLQGGYVSGSYGFTNWLSVAGEFTGGHASGISLLGQDLNLMTFTGGPRVTRYMGRFTPFAEALFGGAHASDSYFPTSTSYTTSASSWALQAGGGVDIGLTERFAVRAVNVDYLRTALPNGSTDEQNQLMIGAGIVMKFGGHRYHSEPIPVIAQVPAQLSFNCSSNVAGVVQGQALELYGNTLTQPAGLSVNYTWNSSGGTIEGAGRQVSINTNGLAPGDYHVSGHAMLASHPNTDGSCQLTFHVLAPQQPAPVVEASTPTKEDEVFHQNVPDALFDYDSYAIRPDAQAAIDKAAQYLKDNESVGVLIAGYADERGSAEYNLALAGKRADSARTALMKDGVDGDRLQIISYGKEAQVCTEQTEACFQQNRRAAFNMRH